MDEPASQTSTLAGDRTPPTALIASITPDSSRLRLHINPETADERATELVNEKSTGNFVDNIVVWDGPDDLECPRNWPSWHKVLFVMVTSGMIVCVSFGSSVFAPAEQVFAKEYGVPLIVGQLGVALWILGFFAGPIFFGPLSEIFGHLLPLTVAFSGMAVFQIPIALGGNVRTVLICRFFAGVFGAGVFAVVSGAYFELFEPIPRGVALASSGMCITLGATLAPIVGVYVTYDGSWRWTAWTTLILVGVLALAASFVVRETSTRKLLQLKAKRLRLSTKNWALHARSEETPIYVGDVVQRYLTKPIRIILIEPILMVITAYLTLVYGILYLAFQAFPKAFQERGWSVKESELPFIAVLLGVISAFLTSSFYTLTVFKRRVYGNDGVAVPEWRLPPMILGAVILPPSLLWFGWSGGVHWICQVIASYLVGYGLLLIFITGVIYIVDVYQSHANSAMSIHIVVRSLVASSFPLWSNIMYNHLGIPWGTSLLAFLCIAMLFAPMIFYRYGAKIRSWSKFSISKSA